MADFVGLTGRQVKDKSLSLEDINGLGSAATKDVGSTTGTVAAGDHAHTGTYEPANSNIQAHIGSTSNPHSVTAAQAGAIPTGEKGANSGVATLDGSGKIPAAQLPNSVMDYKGTYNADTNSPALEDGTGNAGDVYAVTVGGTNDYGSGDIELAVGDWVIYNGSVWEKSSHSGTSVVYSISDPAMNGTADDGVANTVSRGDHVHPTDTSRAASTHNHSGTYEPTITTLAVSKGGTGATTATANYVFAAPNGSAGAPTFRAIVAADIPTLNQNTSGSSGSCTGTAANASNIAITTDATNATRYVTFVTATSGNLPSYVDEGLAYNPGTNTLTTTISGSSTSCTGNAANITGIAAVSHGGTGVDASSTTAKYFFAAPNGSAGAPSFRAIVASDIPTLNQNTTGSSGSCTGNAAYASAVTLTADNSTNATNYPLFTNAATGNLSPRTDTGFTYNPSTGRLAVAVMNIGTSAPATPVNGDIWMV